MLSVEEKAEFLGGGIFGGLDGETRLVIAQRMGQRDLQDGDTLFFNGEPGDEIFIITTGQIEIHIADHVIAVLESGQIFGEMACFGGGRRTAGARARGETQLLFLKDRAVRLLIQQVPDLAFGFFKVLSDRLEEANKVSRFLAEPRTEYGTVEVVSGELAGQTFPLNHTDTSLGRAQGGITDVLRVSLPVSDDELFEFHARVSISDGHIFIEPQDGEVRVNGEQIDDGVGVGPEDTVEAGGLELRFRPQ